MKMIVLLAMVVAVSATHADERWQRLFDGQTLAGWKANESPATWSVVDGAIVAKGPVSHYIIWAASLGISS